MARWRYSMMSVLALVVACHFHSSHVTEAFLPECSIPGPFLRHHSHHPHTICRLERSTNDDESEEEDWRAFRAKLVQSGITTLEDTAKVAASTSAASGESIVTEIGQYIFDTGKMVERGSVLCSIPTLDLCQGIEQNYFHRCVVLVTDTDVQWDDEDDEGNVDMDGNNGIANAEREGMGGIRGIILNRPSNLIIKEKEGGDPWNIWFGGDISGLHRLPTGETEFVCLHSLDSEESQMLSIQIMPGLSYTSLDGARKLVSMKIAKTTDFSTFGGFCAWKPGQLQLLEMGEDRDEWYSVSMDAKSLLDGIQRLGERSESAKLTAGVEMWDELVTKIGKTDSFRDRLSSGRLKFYDRMLKAWTEENLNYDDTEAVGKNTIATLLRRTGGAGNEVRQGSIVRANLQCPLDASKKERIPPFLLDDQEFHRAAVLILEENEEATFGVILNVPMGGEIEVMGEATMPLRYGGPIGAEETLQSYDENEEEGGDPFVWLHYRDPSESSANVGTLIGQSGIYRLTDDEALSALQEGKVRPDEVMVLAGVCIWEKDENLGMLGGGMFEQIYGMGHFEIVDPNRVANMWEILKRQEVLTVESFGSNMEKAVEAWKVLGGEGSSEREDDYFALADAALQAWVSIHLLGEPMSTDIERTWPLST